MSKSLCAVVLLGTLASLGGCAPSASQRPVPPPPVSQVTGLGAIQPEANATGAVTTVTPDAGGTSNASLVEELFAGRIPGLQVYDGDRVRIRGIAQDAGLGSSDPLVVIDGMPSQLGVLQALRGFRPDQISKIQILKDVSSTAIYGTRGAAGVILVTLKQH